MARIEQQFDIRSTFFFLATAEYFGTINNSGLIRSDGIGKLIREVADTGSEIGIHNDLYTVMIKHNIDPFVFNKDEQDFYASLGISIKGSASHGSPLAKQTIPNFNIFRECSTVDNFEYENKKYQTGTASLTDYGYSYEAYHIDYDLYFSDSGGRWNDPEGIEAIIKKIKQSKPGTRIQILVHPDWWGKI